MILMPVTSLATWSPEDAGLVEILAVDIVGTGRMALEAKPSPGPRHGTSSPGLRAEVGLFQAFDLATEPASGSPLISSTVNPVVSVPPAHPVPETKAE